MTRQKLWQFVTLLAAVALLAAACTTPTTEAPPPEPTAEPVAEEPAEEPAAEMPTELKIAFVTNSPFDEPWNATWFEAFERVKAEQPHGLTITVDSVENIFDMGEAERVMREFAETGEYGIIYGHSTFSDAIVNLKDDFPEILWGYAGSGNEGLGGNAYWTYMYVHEPAYLMGMVAGLMTETNVIGIVAGFPADDGNVPINAFIDGARDVNPEIEAKVTFIESWYDPPKAKEATFAQVAAGADFIYAERFGPFEACEEVGCLGFGHWADQNALSPDVVVTSPIAFWDGNIEYMVDAWWDHVANGAPYDAPTEAVWFNMAEGGSDLASFHGFADTLPEDVLNQVEQAKEDILAGELEVPLDGSIPVSD